MAGKKESTACSSGAPDVGTFLASGSSAKKKKEKEVPRVRGHDRESSDLVERRLKPNVGAALWGPYRQT